MAAALARASFAGAAAARLSLAEMMGVRGARVAPRGLGGRRRPGLHARPARTGRTKNPMLFHRFCIDGQFTAREIATSRA